MANEQELNTNFVLEVEKYPCLYNYTLPEYVWKDTVNKAWDEIGHTFNLTGAQCKEKWKNLRNVYVRNLKTRQSGPGAKKRPYYLADVMHFILPYTKLSNSKTSAIGHTNQTANSEDYDGETTITDLQSSGSPSMLYNFTQVTQSPHESINPYSQPAPSPSPPPQSPSGSLSASPKSEPALSPPEPSTSSRKRARKANVSVKHGILQYLNKIESRKASQNLEHQPKKMFLLSLLPDLENMCNRQMRVFKKRVTQIIEEIMDETPPPPLQDPLDNSEITVDNVTVAEESSKQNHCNKH